MNEDMNSMFAEDAKKPTEEGLAEVVQLAMKQLALEEHLAALADMVSEATQNLKELAEKTLPEKMNAMGLTEFKLDNGYKIVIKKMYFGSISETNAIPAFEWLKKEGHDDIIKNKVQCDFGRGEEEKAEKLVKLLQENEVQFESKKFVHPQTLKAFVKEQMTAGKEGFPTDLFGAFTLDKSSVVVPKK